MIFVLDSFKVSLFTDVQEEKEVKATVNLSESCPEFFPETYKTESSAYSIVLWSSVAEMQSFMYNKKNRGPKIDPCGTPLPSLYGCRSFRLSRHPSPYGPVSGLSH